MHDDGRPTVALVSREFWPFLTGGGIARYTRATATLLAESADVTVILPDFYEGKVAPDDPRLPRGVRFEFVPEPDRSDPRPFASLYHAWSAAAYEALCRLYPDGGPDLVEFNDYAGEGAVAVQAKRSGAPALAGTRVVVGVHGADEIHRVLNGQSLAEPEAAAIVSLERIGLAGADVIFTPGGDVHGTYERYYGAGALAPARMVTHPFLNADAPLFPAREPGGPLRLLHVGRFERRKGVAELIEAVRSLERDDVRLTLIGGDTPTGPGGSSMLEHSRALAGDDPRIELRGQTDHDGVLRAYAEHDVVVLPSRWETFANTAREALMVGRPVLATPTGGLVRMIEHGVNGWLTAGTGVADIAAAVEELLDDRSQVERLAGSEKLRESLSRSVRNDETRQSYLDELAREHDPAPAPVSVGVCVVDPRAPLPALPPGDAVALVPAGAELAPGFVEACGRALGAAPQAAYATSWADADDPWQARPLGNAVPLVEHEDCGGAVLVVRRPHAEHALARIGSAELAGGGAWLVARELRAKGEHGACVPEELVRVRDMPGWRETTVRRTEVESALRRDATPWPARTGPRSAHGPRTSVLMAAYNPDPDQLGEAVDSVLGQTVGELELLVVDDGSDRPLADLLAGTRDERLRIVRHRSNRGLSAARNTALRLASAPLISHLDSDDAWEPDYLEGVLPAFADPGIGVAYANAEIVGHPDGHDTYIFDPAPHPMDSFPKIAEQNPVPLLTATARTEAVRRAGGYNRWLRSTQDYHLWLRLAAAGWRFAYVDRKLARYRWPTGAGSLSDDRRSVEIDLLVMWLCFFLRHPGTPGPRRQLRVRLGRELDRLRRNARRQR